MRLGASHLHFKLITPLHGWHEFIHEIVIVVIGVLLALAGAEIVDSLRWRSEVRSFRKAIDHELGRNLGIYRSVIMGRTCVAGRLAELERFLADSTAGKRDRLLHPIGQPFLQTLYFSVWDNKGSDAADHLPLDLRIAYGELYDEFRNNEKVLLNERDVWRSLSQFEQPVTLDSASQLRMRELLTRAEQFNTAATGNYEYVVTLARPLGINPIADPQLTPIGSTDTLCQPLLARA
jgi:hypothetical protein